MWGSVCLSRSAGAPDFTLAEARFVGGLAEPLALALRGALLLEADAVVADGAPGHPDDHRRRTPRVGDAIRPSSGSSS